MTDILAEHDTPDRGRHDANGSLASLTEQQVRVSLTPLATVTSLLIEALGIQRGSPPAWYGAVRSALDPDDVALLGPLVSGNGTLLIPNCLVPKPEGFAPGFSEELERVASTSADDLLADLAVHGLLDTAWSSTTRAPRRWLCAYAACLGRAWAGARPLWERARPLLETEVDRVGGALARGAFDVLLRGLSPRVDVVNDRWFMEGNPRPMTFAPGMTLTPMICGPRGLLVADRDDMVDEFGYPLHGARQLSEVQSSAADGDALQALLGEPRAQLLRRLDRAVTAGSLAESMLYAPSAISHHLLALERAGLVYRERSGRHVLVHRTSRGTALVSLYDS